ncbi:acyl carrier protein [Rhodococcus sp. IEGM 1381]|uniref:acyl carrier protein n=1 Tax=Rhodococcus sp. IEGM 1381 TaxID=3047085 RepID=UPI0024B7697D|nr:acyl carrier protein [Rhodococcus sp. IEGM 1381]MDI9894477.1 acyl carrier protein [Rhodococcus sp. IEGM 1381]
MTETTRTEHAHVADWLAERIGVYIGVPAGDIDRGALLSDLGLDSVYVLTLCGDVEDEYGLMVEPTLAWDHPTVDEMAEYIESERAAA